MIDIDLLSFTVGAFAGALVAAVTVTWMWLRYIYEGGAK